MNIVITGGCGHIGTYISNKLANEAGIKKIYLIDNFQKENFTYLYFKDKKIQIIYLDTTKDLDLKYFKNLGISTLIHLAAITNAEDSFKKRNFIKRNNYQSTVKLVNFANKLNIKLIFISSTSVYGSSKIKNINEDTKDAINPQSPYAEYKLKEENFIRKNSKNFIIFRFGTITGTSIGMRFHTAINKFCLQAHFREPITVWKTAMNQKRPYLSLEDSYRSIKWALNKNNLNETFNVLSDNMSVSDILKIIKLKIPNIKIKFVNSKIMNQLSYDVSNKKIINQGLRIKKSSIKKSIFCTLKLLNGEKNLDFKELYKIN